MPNYYMGGGEGGGGGGYPGRSGMGRRMSGMYNQFINKINLENKNTQFILMKIKQ